MGRYVVYPSYKLCNADRLDVLPSHWSVAPLRRLLTVPLVNGLFKKREFWGGGVKIVNVFDAYIKGDVIDETALDRVICDDSELKKYLVMHGDFVFVRSSLKLEGIGKAASILNPTENLVFECHLVRGRPDTNQIDPAFLCYFLNSSYSRQSLVALSNQVTMATIDQEKFKSLSIAIPSISEQQNIANFLDFKTAQIDALIAKKQTLLEKLAEKRTALISHTVTKGLDPSAPMKDSGVAWLGEIPVHWDAKKVKHFTQILRGKFSHRPRNDPRFYDGEYPFIQTGDVANANKFITAYSQTLNEEGLKVSREFPAGTLVMTIAANIGNMAILNFNACFPDSIVGFVPLKGVNLNYLFYMFTAMRQQLLSTAVLNTQLNLNIERIADQFGSYPPVNEQTAIAEYLDLIVSEMVAQAKSIADVVERLQEYRSALITNAVTGKIDVRGFQLPSDNAAKENVDV